MISEILVPFHSECDCEPSQTFQQNVLNCPYKSYNILDYELINFFSIKLSRIYKKLHHFLNKSYDFNSCTRPICHPKTLDFLTKKSQNAIFVDKTKHMIKLLKNDMV